MKHTWKRVGRETLHDTRIYRLYQDQFEHHGTRDEAVDRDP